MFFSTDTVVQCHVVKDKGVLENTGTVSDVRFLRILPRSCHSSNNPTSFGTQVTPFSSLFAGVRCLGYISEFGI